jgi:mannitol/fructose-specific phosphotransferase system IIA component (Ntr-type)
VGILWYTYYARDRVTREGAIYHVFERLGRQRDLGLEMELREILKEKGLRKADPFEELISRAVVIDLEGPDQFSNVVNRVSATLSRRHGLRAKQLADGFIASTEAGVTAATHGALLPHLHLAALSEPTMVLVRAKESIEMDIEILDTLLMSDQPVYAAFFLASPEDEPGLHLRILAQIAARVDDETFLLEWIEAADEQELKEVMLRDEHMCVLDVRPNHPSAVLIGHAIRDLALPETTLVAMIRRGSDFVVPHGSTTIELGDRLTVLGEPQGIIDLRHRYEDQH